ncbi:unnamed protein product [Candidula unifasciata]|uniref:ETS domain-containing protein n=1 Tax=Candidula unifasciata TaxID=100452 RepID=A0A8S3ZGH2_9EUPU|nr:unnamed protein product [Candidula unifasciata]
MMMKTQESLYDESDDSGVSSLEDESRYTNLTNVPQPANENGICYGYDAPESNLEDWSMGKTVLSDIFNIEQDILLPDNGDPFDMDNSAQESDECDSGSTDGDPFRHCFTFPDGYRPVIDFQSFHPYSEQESVVSSDGEVIETTLPNFSQIQNSTESEKVSLYVPNISLSPKKKRKIVRDSPSYVEKERRKPGRKPGQVSNVLHLWEFMRDLLHSSENQGIIEWISKPDGVFKVINSTEVARLWGEKKKNKKKMTYEKLSRSLRYSRLEGYFADLPRDKNYPKKLCFKFGPKSKDWH